MVVMDSVRCPYCGFEGKFKVLKTWKFGFYEVKSFDVLSAVVCLIITMALVSEQVRHLSSLLRGRQGYLYE